MKGITRLPLGVRSSLIFERFWRVVERPFVFVVVPQRDRSICWVPGKTKAVAGRDVDVGINSAAVEPVWGPRESCRRTEGQEPQETAR